jgi:hypothetical protein
MAQSRAPTDLELRPDRAAVVDALRDPQSAYFRNTELRLQADGSFLVCGSVAGRNAHGGMGEAMPFYLSPGFSPSFVDDQSRYDLTASSRQSLLQFRLDSWQSLCRERSSLVRRLMWND